MSEIVIPGLYLISGVCAYAMVTHLNAGLRRPFDLTHILFAGLCLFVLPLVLSLIHVFQAVSVDEFVVALKWNLAAVILFLALFPWFIALYTEQVHRPFILVMNALFALLFVLNIIQPYSIQFGYISGLHSLSLPWGETIVRADGVNSPWFYLGSACAVASFGYAVYALSSLYRCHRSRASLGMLLAMGLFLVSALAGILARLSVIHFVELGPFGFLCMVIMMSVVLSHETQHRLRNSENRFRSLVEQSPFSIQILSPDGHTLKVNTAWEKLWGVCAKNAIGYNILQDRQLVERGVMSYIEQGFAGVATEIPPLFYDGADHGPLRDRWVRAYIYPIKDEDGTVREAILMHEDVTERQRAEQAVLAASQAKDVFLANMTHELRTPLNAIIGYSDLLRDSVDDSDPADVSEALEAINKAGYDLLRLINQILDISQLRSNELKLERIWLPVAEHLQEICSSIESLVTNNGDRLVVHCSQDAGDIFADPLRLNQILYMLLDNAAKFTRNGTITLSAGSEQVGDRRWIRYSIQDAGIGMTEEQLSRVFREFEQGDNSITRGYGGAGLGLNIAKQLVELMGGTMMVASEPGVGSEFVVCLPADG